jgi:hypothetical protein
MLNWMKHMNGRHERNNFPLWHFNPGAGPDVFQSMMIFFFPSYLDLQSHMHRRKKKQMGILLFFSFFSPPSYLEIQWDPPAIQEKKLQWPKVDKTYNFLLFL